MAEKSNRMSVPFMDLKAQYRTIRTQVQESINSVLESQHFILGPMVEKLEKECAAHCACKYALGVSSGTDALLMALMALDVKPGDEVITTNFSFFATAAVIYRLGARPVFVDIDLETYNIKPQELEKAITGKTRVVMPVHLYGQCAEMDEIQEIARKHKLAVIEDGAQAFGAHYRGRPAGSLGDIGCFSFYPTKNLGGIGEGGLVTLTNQNLYQKLLDLRNQGSVQRGPYQLVGGNFRLDAIQAAGLLAKLPHLKDWNKSRAEKAATYCRLFQKAGLVGKITLPKQLDHCAHIYHQFVIRAERRDALQDFLKQKDVASGVYYPRTLNQEPCFAYLGYRQEQFPNSNRAARETLALPVYPELAEEQQVYLVDMVREFYR